MARKRRQNKYQREVCPLETERIMNYTHYDTADNGMQYTVHHIKAAQKEYVCPGCGGVILVGEAHEVAWTEDSWFGREAGQAARRHWHTSCWNARGRRQPLW